MRKHNHYHTENRRGLPQQSILNANLSYGEFQNTKEPEGINSDYRQFSPAGGESDHEYLIKDLLSTARKLQADRALEQALKDTQNILNDINHHPENYMQKHAGKSAAEAPQTGRIETRQEKRKKARLMALNITLGILGVVGYVYSSIEESQYESQREQVYSKYYDEAGQFNYQLYFDDVEAKTGIRLTIPYRADQELLD